MGWLFDIKYAFSFFSILPIRFRGDEGFEKSKMILFLPLVGVALGVISLLPYLLLKNILFAVVSGVFYIFLYGFIHLEAVIDVVDAIYAKLAGKDAYKIIKEPTVGAIGVLWGVGIFTLKVAGFSYLLFYENYFVLLAILVFSRVSLVWLVGFLEFNSSFVNSLKEGIKREEIYIMSLIVGLLFIKYLYLLFIALALGFFVANMVKKRLGFINGDVLGFVLEVVEIVLLLSYGAI